MVQKQLIAEVLVIEPNSKLERESSESEIDEEEGSKNWNLKLKLKLEKLKWDQEGMRLEYQE